MKHDYKHMHKSSRIEPSSDNWQDGWDYTLGDRLVDLLIAGTAAFFMAAGVVFTVTQIAIRGLS